MVAVWPIVICYLCPRCLQVDVLTRQFENKINNFHQNKSKQQRKQINSAKNKTHKFNCLANGESFAVLQFQNNNLMSEQMQPMKWMRASWSQTTRFALGSGASCIHPLNVVLLIGVAHLNSLTYTNRLIECSWTGLAVCSVQSNSQGANVSIQYLEIWLQFGTWLSLLVRKFSHFRAMCDSLERVQCSFKRLRTRRQPIKYN